MTGKIRNTMVTGQAIAKTQKLKIKRHRYPIYQGFTVFGPSCIHEFDLIQLKKEEDKTEFP